MPASQWRSVSIRLDPRQAAEQFRPRLGGNLIEERLERRRLIAARLAAVGGRTVLTMPPLAAPVAPLADPAPVQPARMSRVE